MLAVEGAAQTIKPSSVRASSPNRRSGELTVTTAGERDLTESFGLELGFVGS